MGDFFTIVLIGMAISVAVFAFGLIQVRMFFSFHPFSLLFRSAFPNSKLLKLDVEKDRLTWIK